MRVIQQVCCAAQTHDRMINIIIESFIHARDALMKCTTHELRIAHYMYVNCMFGHL